jgi:hypothetical protein
MLQTELCVSVAKQQRGQIRLRIGIFLKLFNVFSVRTLVNRIIGYECRISKDVCHKSCFQSFVFFFYIQIGGGVGICGSLNLLRALK